ncbi:MAG: hypothetical protein J7539_13090, partial [Niabella sp.]|nr:hypothetical protein [Niabella sp.]
GYGAARIHCYACPNETGGPNYNHGIIEIKNGNEIIAGANYYSSVFRRTVGYLGAKYISPLQ